MSEQHSLTVQYDTGCFGDTSGTWSAEVHGLLVRGEGNTWPFSETEPLAADMPAVLRSLSNLARSRPNCMHTGFAE